MFLLVSSFICRSEKESAGLWLGQDIRNDIPTGVKWTFLPRHSKGGAKFSSKGDLRLHLRWRCPPPFSGYSPKSFENSHSREFIRITIVENDGELLTKVLWKRKVWQMGRFQLLSVALGWKFQFAPVHDQSASSVHENIPILIDQLIWFHRKCGSVSWSTDPVAVIRMTQQCYLLLR